MIRIFLTNLGKYNEGELCGEWVSLPVSPVNLAFIKKRIGINEEYEEYFITDWETDLQGLHIDEYDPISYLNDIAEQIAFLGSFKVKALQAYLLDGYSPQEAIEAAKRGDYGLYPDCSDMIDVVHQIVDEGWLLDGMPDDLAKYFYRYFDYIAYAQDLEDEGRFYFIDGDCIELH